MKKIFIVNGIHGSGKSTFGKLLADQNNELVYYPEIGGQLRSEVNYNALDSGDAFDEEVMRRELERDNVLINAEGTPVVETWHFGNIAYAHARSPDVEKRYIIHLDEQLQIFDPIPIFVDIDEPTFRTRYTEKINPEEVDTLYGFYMSIKGKILDLYSKYGLEPIIIHNTGELSDSLNELKEKLNTPFVLEKQTMTLPD